MSAYGDYNAAWCDPEALIDFVTVTSDFYPELQAYYAEEAKEWLAQVEAGGRRLITSDPGAHWVEQECAVGYLRVQAGGRVRKGPGQSPTFLPRRVFVACLARRCTHQRVKRAVALNFRFDGKQAGGLVKFHTCADPVGGTGPGEVRMRTDTRPLTRLGRAGRPSDRRSAMRTASALTLAVASALARTRWSHGASGRASTGRLAAP